jgi:hypothetical protein
MDDGRDLAGVQRPARMQPHQHRRGGRLLLAGEHRFLGKGQMDAGGFHRADGHHRPGQLAFQRVLVAGGLHELADAEAVFLLQRLQAVDRAARQALAGELQARFVNLIGRTPATRRCG